ncbi:MAG TPA: c-type cytochrome [Polyangiaceae bacterium]|nr:c-type cytochrome [Polyangiaceae bacterium]
MTKKNKLLTIRSLSIGFSAAALALACGSDSNTPTNEDPIRPPAEDPCANPLSATCPTKVTEPDDTKTDTDPGGGGGGGGGTSTPPKAKSQQELDKATVENILQSNCGYCHGPKLTPAQAQAGMNYIDDIDQLVKTGKIVPLNSSGSPLVQRIKKGEMPPASSSYPQLTDADVDKVVSFIDNPRYWPDYRPADCSDKDQLVTFDDVFQEVNDDLSDADNKDAPFFRYISLTNRFTAGVCKEALDKDRQGLVKMMNMLSIKANTGEVVPVNSEETLYRVDLRDFDWDRPITVNGTPFDDVWEAIAQNNPYAVEFFGDDADDAKDDAQTAFPVMFADQMMDTAIIGNLYYAIVDIDVTQSLDTFISQKLGIDVDENIANEESGTIRAGTTKSRISRQDRLVERHDIVVRNGAFWQSFDFQADQGNESIFEDPFGFTPGGTEAIFTLPNGMLAFIIADANGNIVQDSDILLDTSQNNFKAITAVSCSNCHNTGFIPVVDEVRDVTLANARDIGLNRDEVEQIEAIYVKPAEFASVAKADSEGFYQRALQSAELPIQGGDPVANTFLRFDQDITLHDAAGDLGVTADDLDRSLGLLDPRLAVLGTSRATPDGGTIDRDDFTAQFFAALCVMTEANENAPDQALCDDALGR